MQQLSGTQDKAEPEFGGVWLCRTQLRGCAGKRHTDRGLWLDQQRTLWREGSPLMLVERG